MDEQIPSPEGAIAAYVQDTLIQNGQITPVGILAALFSAGYGIFSTADTETASLIGGQFYLVPKGKHE